VDTSNGNFDTLNSASENGGALNSTTTDETPRPSGIQIPPGTTLEDLERAAVEQALNEHHGNRTHAAKSLGISVRTLQRKLKAWHGSNNAATSPLNETRSNMSKLRQMNTWNTAGQGMSHPLSIRSHAARV
jgi:hypothetical protein